MLRQQLLSKGVQRGVGGGEPKGKRKKLRGPAAAEKVLRIEGMHCETAKNRVERLLDQMDGAAAKADLKKNIAVVSMSREIGDAELKAAVVEELRKSLSNYEL